MSSGSMSGYSLMISAGDIPFATKLTRSETVILIPRMQARPARRSELNVIRSSMIMVPGVKWCHRYYRNTQSGTNRTV